MKGRFWNSSSQLFFSSDIWRKMRAEVQKVFSLYEELVEAGNNATLTLSSWGGKPTIKLQLESPPPSPPLTATTTTLPPVPGRRRRHRGSAARARRQKRAADHQASLLDATATTASPAAGEATATSGPPPQRPLHLLESPSLSAGRRRVMSLGRQHLPSFSNLNLDGPPPSPPPQSSPTPTPSAPSSSPSKDTSPSTSTKPLDAPFTPSFFPELNCVGCKTWFPFKDVKWMFDNDLECHLPCAPCCFSKIRSMMPIFGLSYHYPHDCNTARFACFDSERNCTFVWSALAELASNS